MSVKPWDILNPNEPKSEELSKERLAICLQCPYLIKSTKQCRKCGCFMEIKTKLVNATCPLKKW